MLIEQLINLEKVRAESADNLKFRTDLQDLAMDGWSVTQDEFLQRQIAQKILKSKIEAGPVNAGHYIAFKFQTLHFIYDLFGCKLWLLLIQNHA